LIVEKNELNVNTSFEKRSKSFEIQILVISGTGKRISNANTQNSVLEKKFPVLENSKFRIREKIFRIGKLEFSH